MIEIIIVDDHSLIHSSIEKVLQELKDHKFVIKAFDGLELLQKLQYLKSIPSIAIVDIRMPNINGVILTQLLQNYYPDIKVIGVSYLNNPGAYSAIMEAGAKGFLCKANLHHLKEAVQTVLAGDLYMDPDIREDWEAYQKKHIPSEPQNEYNFSKLDIEQLLINATGLEYAVLSKTFNLGIECLNKRQKIIKEKTGLSSRVAQTLLAIQLGIVKVFRT